MFHPLHYPHQAFYETWKNIVLFDEHTWGSWNSISEPESPFTLSQWKIKRQFAINAGVQTRNLLKEGLSGEKNAGRRITVLNTLSWKRSGFITLQDIAPGKAPELFNEKGKKVPCQKNRDGSWTFFSGEVPAFGWKVFRVNEMPARPQKLSLPANPWTLDNDSLKIIVDESTGSIRSMMVKATGYELADTLMGQGLNGYVYIRGRKPDHPEKPLISWLLYAADGPVYASLVFSSDAPGSHGLEREIRLYRPGNEVEIINTLDKEKTYFPESVFFTFPFRMPGGRTLIDIARGAYRPGKDQLPGSCKNYFTVQRWVDISDDQKGVTWFTPDAPMIELGHITTDANQTGWLRQVQQPEQHILSYVMNNYWGTNYKASQEGKTVFRYRIIPHRRFDRALAKKQGIETGQPLLVIRGVPVRKSRKNIPVPANDLIITWIQPVKEGLLVRLFNPSEKTLPLKLQWKDHEKRILYKTDPLGHKVEKMPENEKLLPLEIITLIIKESNL